MSETPKPIAISIGNDSSGLSQIVKTGMQDIGFEIEESHELHYSQGVQEWVNYFLDHPFMAVMAIGATAYVKKLAESAAEGTWKNRRELCAVALRLTGGACGKLFRFATMIADTIKAAGNHFSTAAFIVDHRVMLRFHGDDIGVLDTFARFVYLFDVIDRTSKNITASLPDNRYIMVLMTEEGFILQWLVDEKWYAQKFDETGKETGPKFETTLTM